MSRTIQPLGDKVLVSLDEVKDKTPGGIIIPESAQKREHGGAKVIAIGPDVKGVEVGNHVLTPKFKGSPIKSDDLKEQLVIIKEEDIVAILG
jgi:chaperonin GroES